MKTGKIIIRRRSKNNAEIAADLELLEKLAGYGLTEKEIANVLNVTVKQFQYAVRRNRQLNEAMSRGRDKAATMVMESLFRKATGYERREVEIARYQGKTFTHPVTKYYPPDMNAIVFWLKNMCPLLWKEKVDYNLKLEEEYYEKLRQIALERMKEKL